MQQIIGDVMIDKTKVIELIQKGLSDSEIALKLDCSRTTIWRIRNKTTIMKLNKQGMSIRQIADKMGIDENKVWRVLSQGKTVTNKIKPKNKLCTIRFKGTITYYK